MTFAKYPKMKESGIESIGEIPEEWNVISLKHIGKLNSGGTPSTGVSAYWENGTIPWISSGEVNNNMIQKSEKKITNLGLIESSAKLFPKNSILIAITGEGATRGRTSVLKIDATTNQSVVGIVLDSKKSYYFFLWYYIQSQYLNLRNSGHGSVQSGLNLNLLQNYPVVLQKISEQKQISSYLDKKTKTIDDEITKNHNLIKLLQEKRQSEINRAVTKGLDDTVPTKDSGIEWIGEIPEEWNSIKLKFLIADGNSITPGPFGSELKTSDYVDKGSKIYNQKDILDSSVDMDLFVSKEKFDKLSSFHVKSGDILLTSRGSIGKSKIIPEKYLPGIIHPCLIRVRIDEYQIKNSYVNLIINESTMFKENIRFNSNGTVIEVIYGKTLKEIIVPVPSLPEQTQIISYLDKKTAKIDSLISKIKSQISKLQELRESLISSAVTGKICVTN